MIQVGKKITVYPHKFRVPTSAIYCTTGKLVVKLRNGHNIAYTIEEESAVLPIKAKAALVGTTCKHVQALWNDEDIDAFQNRHAPHRNTKLKLPAGQSLAKG